MSLINLNFFFKFSFKFSFYQKSLRFFNHSSTGRNNQGKITIQHRGSRIKKLYRQIDYKRQNLNIMGQVAALHYDPNRNLKIALIIYLDGLKRYILAPQKLHLKNFIISGTTSVFKIGNTLKVQDIPIGSFIHNIELHSNKGGQLVRSGGTSAKLLIKQNKFVVIRLPSNEIRLISNSCYATLGTLSFNNKNKKKKAGENRWLGIRPTVRGVAKNACDHPHGGGEGRAPIGRKAPLTPWGKIALGKKTRCKNASTNRYIIYRKIS